MFVGDLQRQQGLAAGSPVPFIRSTQTRRCVVYWCLHTLRCHDNYALSLALALSHDIGAALLVVLPVEEDASPDLAKLIEIKRPGASQVSPKISSVEHSIIRKNVYRLSAQVAFASALEDMGVSVVGSVVHSPVEPPSSSSSSSTRCDDAVSLFLLLSGMRTSADPWYPVAIVSDFTGHPRQSSMYQRLVSRLPTIPFVAVDSVSPVPFSLYKHYPECKQQFFVFQNVFTLDV